MINSFFIVHSQVISNKKYNNKLKASLKGDLKSHEIAFQMWS